MKLGDMPLCKPTVHTCGERCTSAGLIELEDLGGILKGLIRTIKGVKG